MARRADNAHRFVSVSRTFGLATVEALALRLFIRVFDIQFSTSKAAVLGIDCTERNDKPV
jgi:hypothetical protein